MIGKKVTVKVDGEKYRGVVINLQRETQMVDVTLGGSIGGPPPDIHRRFAPGCTSVTLTIDLDPRPVEKRARKGRR